MELIAIIKPQRFEIGFKSTAQKNEKTSTFEEIIYQDSPYQALYTLGTDYTGEKVSPSIGFLCNLSNTFFKEIAKNPDIEELRERANIILEEEVITELLAEVPYMNGMEYLDGKCRSLFGDFKSIYSHG